jgi:hypothetical protein
MRFRRTMQLQYKCPYLATHDIVHAMHSTVQHLKLTNNKKTNLNSSFRFMFEPLLVDSID